MENDRQPRRCRGDDGSFDAQLNSSPDDDDEIGSTSDDSEATAYTSKTAAAVAEFGEPIVRILEAFGSESSVVVAAVPAIALIRGWKISEELLLPANTFIVRDRQQGKPFEPALTALKNTVNRLKDLIVYPGSTNSEQEKSSMVGVICTNARICSFRDASLLEVCHVNSNVKLESAVDGIVLRVLELTTKTSSSGASKNYELTSDGPVKLVQAYFGGIHKYGQIIMETPNAPMNAREAAIGSICLFKISSSWLRGRIDRMSFVNGVSFLTVVSLDTGHVFSNVKFEHATWMLPEWLKDLPPLSQRIDFVNVPDLLKSLQACEAKRWPMQMLMEDFSEQLPQNAATEQQQHYPVWYCALVQENALSAAITLKFCGARMF